MEELIDKLKEFNFYKQMILSGETDGRNVLVEKKDGTHAILHHKVKPQPTRRKAKIYPIPGLAADLGDIERITVFVNGKEYEFVACQ